jgi:hypothetical protein
MCCICASHASLYLAGRRNIKVPSDDTEIIPDDRFAGQYYDKQILHIVLSRWLVQA